MDKAAGHAQAEQRPDTLVWGKNPVTELLKSGEAVDTVYLADTLPPAVVGYYTALAKQGGAVAKRVPAHKLQKMCGTADHQGVAARAAEVRYASLQELFAAAAARQEAPFLVLCDGVEDPHNLGAILRTAEACGVDGVILPKRRSALLTAAVLAPVWGAAALPVVNFWSIFSPLFTGHSTSMRPSSYRLCMKEMYSFILEWQKRCTMEPSTSGCQSCTTMPNAEAMVGSMASLPT